MPKEVCIEDEIEEIGDTLSSISEMAAIEAEIANSGGHIIASEGGCTIISSKNVSETARRLRGSIPNAVIGSLDDSTLFFHMRRFNPDA